MFLTVLAVIDSTPGTLKLAFSSLLNLASRSSTLLFCVSLVATIAPLRVLTLSFAFHLSSDCTRKLLCHMLGLEDLQDGLQAHLISHQVIVICNIIPISYPALQAQASIHTLVFRRSTRSFHSALCWWCLQSEQPLCSRKLFTVNIIDIVHSTSMVAHLFLKAFTWIFMLTLF